MFMPHTVEWNWLSRHTEGDWIVGWIAARTASTVHWQPSVYSQHSEGTVNGSSTLHQPGMEAWCKGNWQAWSTLEKNCELTYKMLKL